jgi:ankyrin repeat protein
MMLLRAIAARDDAAALRRLAAAPALARQAVVVGASRAAASDYFLDAITHYVYAGDTALHVAAAAYRQRLAEKLVAQGADPRARNRRGAEPLHYASDGVPGSPAWDPDAQGATVEYLIEAGADPDATDASGVAPLHRAVRTRCTGAVRALLARGADPRRKNASGSTSLHLAVQTTGRGGSGSPEARAEQAEIIRLLLGHGARPTDTDARGKTVRQSSATEWLPLLGGR